LEATYVFLWIRIAAEASTDGGREIESWLKGKEINKMTLSSVKQREGLQGIG
jgi:hypothetical protein